MQNTGKLKGKTVFITGASRGIGKAIAIKCAKDGANIVIAAKTADPHPKVAGTIYETAAEVEKVGGKALPCIVDVRNEQQIKDAIAAAVQKFGSIDILVNNASFISLTNTFETDMKKWDLMQHVNTRGTFLVSKECLPYLLKSENPHILNISPPPVMKPKYFQFHLGETISKFGMSMCAMGMAEEFREQGVAANTLWPQTAVLTAIVDRLFGTEGYQFSRTTDIMADAAYAIFCRDSRSCTGNFFIDEDVVLAAGCKDLSVYACVKENANKLIDDFLIEPRYGAKL